MQAVGLKIQLSFLIVHKIKAEDITNRQKINYTEYSYTAREREQRLKIPCNLSALCKAQLRLRHAGSVKRPDTPLWRRPITVQDTPPIATSVLVYYVKPCIEVH